MTFSRTTWVWTFVLWASLANLTWGAWGVLGPVVANDDLGGNRHAGEKSCSPSSPTASSVAPFRSLLSGHRLGPDAAALL